jgi:hypothetical protein
VALQELRPALRVPHPEIHESHGVLGDLNPPPRQFVLGRREPFVIGYLLTPARIEPAMQFRKERQRTGSQDFCVSRPDGGADRDTWSCRYATRTRHAPHLDA